MYQFAGHLSRMALYRLLLAKEIIYLSTKLLCFNGPQFAVTGRGKIAAVLLLWKYKITPVIQTHSDHGSERRDYRWLRAVKQWRQHHVYWGTNVNMSTVCIVAKTRKCLHLECIYYNGEFVNQQSLNSVSNVTIAHCIFTTSSFWTLPCHFIIDITTVNISQLFRLSRFCVKGNGLLSGNVSRHISVTTSWRCRNYISTAQENSFNLLIEASCAKLRIGMMTVPMSKQVPALTSVLTYESSEDLYISCVVMRPDWA